MPQSPTHPLECYLLVAVLPGNERTVKDRITALPGVLEVTALFGEFPVLAKVSATNEAGLHHMLETHVYPLEGVLSVKVFVVAPPQD